MDLFFCLGTNARKEDHTFSVIFNIGSSFWGNLRSGPILAVLIHSLLRSFALPAGMLLTKANESRA